MKIVHISKHCREANGNVNVAIDLSCDQVKSGHDVIFASEGGLLEPLLERHGVAITRIKQDGGIIDVLRNMIRFVAFCRREKPDVIHAHMVASAIFGFLAARLCGAKLVTTVHKSFDRQSVLMRLGDAVIAVSHAERDMLAGRGFNPKRLTCILNGPVGSVRETLDQDMLAFPTPCITMVCGLHQRKGVADMLAAFAKLSPVFPDWHLNIIGGGPDQDILARTIEDMGLSRAHLMGAVPHPKPYLEKAAIFVTCSYAEPLGLSTLEARAAGCAIVGSRVGGTPEAVAFGEAGLLFEPGDRDTLVAHCKTLMGSSDALADWQRRARADSSCFSVTRMTRDHNRLYRRLTLAGREGDGPVTPPAERRAGAPLISIVVATKGRTAPFARLFASLQAQTLTDFEVIVVDQNFDDRVGSPETEGWTVPIRHLRTPNETGSSRARNAGLAVADGTFCLFPDDDCWYPDGFLAHAVELMTTFDADVVSGRATDETGRSINGRYQTRATLITRGNVFTSGIEWVALFRRDALQRIGGYDAKIGVGAETAWQSCEGQDIMLRAMADGRRCIFDPSLTGHHAELDCHSPSMRTKGRHYARGLGFVLRRNGFSPLVAASWIARPLAGAILATLRRDTAMRRYYVNVAIGRLEGWRMKVPQPRRDGIFGRRRSAEAAHVVARGRSSLGFHEPSIDPRSGTAD